MLDGRHARDRCSLLCFLGSCFPAVTSGGVCDAAFDRLPLLPSLLCCVPRPLFCCDAMPTRVPNQPRLLQRCSVLVGSRRTMTPSSQELRVRGFVCSFVLDCSRRSEPEDIMSQRARRYYVAALDLRRKPFVPVSVLLSRCAAATTEACAPTPT
jgi:hypothetical protein